MWSSKTALLSLVVASALGAPHSAPDSYGIEIVKRGTPLSPRDIELAEVHGVNTTESMLFNSMLDRCFV